MFIPTVTIALIFNLRYGGFMAFSKLKREKSDIVMSTEIEDIRLTSALDVGFYQEFQITSETHSHTFFELFITIGGSLCLETLGGEAVILNEGSFCLIPPSVYHKTRVIESEAKKLAIRFQLEKNCTISDAPSLYERISSKLSTISSISVYDGCSDIYSSFCELRNEILNPSIASDDYASAVLTRLYICLFRQLLAGREETYSFNSGFSDLTAERKLKIEEYFFLNFKEHITEDDMAREMNISKRQLNRILQRIYGVGFRRHLIDIRLHRSAQLLIESELSIAEICESVGYTSLSGFYSAFKQKFDISAGQYRRKFRKQDIKY